MIKVSYLAIVGLSKMTAQTSGRSRSLPRLLIVGKTRKKKARVLFSCLRFLNSVDRTISEPGTSNQFHDSALQYKNPYFATATAKAEVMGSYLKGFEKG